jgi:hypothetical protein
MINNKPSFFCRICGLNQHEYPWGEDNKTPSFGICACCGGEFGYHDSTLEAIREHRKLWLLKGGKWSEEKEMPSSWSLEEQMNNIPIEYL